MREHLRGWLRAMVRALPAAAIANAVAASLASLPAAAAEIRRPDFLLTYDGTVWTERPAPPPADLALDCIANACGRGVAIVAIREARPLPRPGAGAFTPGAAAAAALPLRVQALTPGGRLIATAPVEPIVVAGRSCYRADFAIEDRDLARRMLAVVIMPMGATTLHWRLTAPRASSVRPGDLPSLLAGLSLP